MLWIHRVDRIKYLAKKEMNLADQFNYGPEMENIHMISRRLCGLKPFDEKIWEKVKSHVEMITMAVATDIPEEYLKSFKTEEELEKILCGCYTI